MYVTRTWQAFITGGRPSPNGAKKKSNPQYPHATGTFLAEGGTFFALKWVPFWLPFLAVLGTFWLHKGVLFWLWALGGSLLGQSFET